MNDGRTVFTSVGIDQLRAAASDHDNGNDQTRVQPALDTRLELRSASFVCAWLGIVALHGICAVYLTQLARIYWFIKHPYLDYYARLATGDRYDYLHHASVAIGLIAALHYWQLLCILWATLCARELAFPDNNSSAAWSMVSRLSMVQSGTNRLSSITTSGRYKKLTWPSRIVMGVWRFFFSRHGVFGIESHLFHVVFTMRELIEIVSQTFQAHLSSELLSRRWLNNFLMALIVTNCWSTPILQYAFRRHQGKERTACLLIDAILNMGSSMVVPLAVFWPYYQALDPETLQFSLESLYDELWFTRLAMEIRLLFSISTTDMFSKLIPHLAIYSSLASVVTLVHRSGSRRWQARVLASVEATSDNPNGALSKSRLHTTGPPIDAVLNHQVRSTRSTRCKQAAVHLFFFAWGLTVLGLHVRAGMRFNDTMLGCRQTTGAWFATDYPCSLYTYNCYRQGTSTPDEDSWTQLDKEALVYLTVAHCPALKMPHSFQTFPNLLGLHIHNVTLVEWSKASAISATKHAKMIAFIVTRTNMTQLPDGVLEPLPLSLVDIEFSHTNLTMLPADLHERWHPLRTMYFEHSLLTEFPEQLLALDVPELSLHGNRIERMPELPADMYFYILVLAANPLKELPDRIGSGTILSFLSLENTQLETLPAWTHTNVEDTAYLHGTPYCTTQTRDVVDSARITCLEFTALASGGLAIDVLDRNTPF